MKRRNPLTGEMGRTKPTPMAIRPGLSVRRVGPYRKGQDSKESVR